MPPIKGVAHGSIVINGSITGYVFGERDEIVIYFDAGAIIRIEPEDHEVAQFLTTSWSGSRRRGSRPELCELGIGANTAVSELTGATLLDEKAYDTAHIAIGANKPFGGTVDPSHIHEDLIFRCPTITINDKPVINRGNLVVNDSDWRPSHQQVVLIPPYTDADALAEWSGAEYELGSGEILQRLYVDGIGNRQRVTTGDRETSRLAAELIDLLSSDGFVSLKRIAEQLQWDTEKAQRILQILGETYSMVNLKSDE